MRKETKEIKNAIYPYEKYIKISGLNYWGDDPQEDYFAIYGDDAVKSAAENGLIIKGELNPYTMYIFRWTRNSDGLVPAHVSMKPKTAANIMKGSARYGSAAITREAFSSL